MSPYRDFLKTTFTAATRRIMSSIAQPSIGATVETTYPVSGVDISKECSKRSTTLTGMLFLLSPPFSPREAKKQRFYFVQWFSQIGSANLFFHQM